MYDMNKEEQQELNEDLIIKYTEYAIALKLPQNETIFLICTLLYHDPDFTNRHFTSQIQFFVNCTFEKVGTEISSSDYKCMISSMVHGIYGFGIPYLPKINSDHITIELLVEKLKNGELESLIKVHVDKLTEIYEAKDKIDKINTKSALETKKDEVRIRYIEPNLSNDEHNFLINSIISKSYLNGNLFKYLLSDSLLPDPYPKYELHKFAKILIKRLRNGELIRLIEALDKDITEALNTVEEYQLNCIYSGDIKEGNIKAWQVHIIDTWDIKETEDEAIEQYCKYFSTEKNLDEGEVSTISSSLPLFHICAGFITIGMWFEMLFADYNQKPLGILITVALPFMWYFGTMLINYINKEENRDYEE